MEGKCWGGETRIREVSFTGIVHWGTIGTAQDWMDSTFRRTVGHNQGRMAAVPEA